MQERPIQDRSTDQAPTRWQAEAAPLYTDEEAQEILSRAMGLNQQGVSRASLVKMATELGISPDELARAEADFRVGGATAQDHKAFRYEQWSRLRQHLVSYLLVVGFLWLFFGFIAFGLGGGLGALTPAILTMLGWGLGLAFDVTDYMTGRSGPEYQRRFEKWHAKQQRRLERAQRRQLPE